MCTLFEYFKTHCPLLRPLCAPALQKKEIGERGTYLFFNAFASSAFTVWMRIGEVSTLQYKNLEFPCGRHKQQPSDCSKDSGPGPGPHFFKLNLRNRKNWQKREKNGESQLSGHTYQIYPQEKTPEIDMHHHMLEWLDFYEQYLLGRPLNDDDYIFPTIGSNGISVQPNRPISPDIAQKKIVQMAELAGVPGAKYFTTHCFRRGGAQYRFMYAPVGERWILARIRWWGGWATGEHRDTLIRYLLDELYTYEEDHSNALCPRLQPNRITEGYTLPSGVELFQGLSRDVTMQVDDMKSELHECRTLLKRVLNAPPPPLPCLQTQLLQPIPTFPSSSVRYLPLNTQDFANTSWSSSTLHTSSPSSPEALYPNSGTSSLETIHLIPGLSRGCSQHAYEQVVRDWEFPDPSRSLYVAMKDWRPEWHRAQKQTQKYGQRKTVALEFIDHFSRDTNRFTAAYPEYKNGFTPLLNAIRKAKQTRGECEERLSRRKH